MNRKEVFEKMNDIFKEVFDDDSLIISDTTTSADIAGWDSLQNINLMISIENVFNVRIGMKEVLAFKNVGEMIDFIHQNLK